ncbi:hypothetical protein A6A04_09635 [Paramagnetospirillum marisnigri]|uniref:Uncharacterized protein n=1 Tax=Paramagnetospirillum marisnigri TaxID=1285242 RepID=A0A178M5H2_9PROT|nr:hypothetical protein [Paramagnetospirillum marisnigri]OAN42957.1 hypothetical protein A6A04_09635 [Paramagnetospirillum marisnigri]
MSGLLPIWLVLTGTLAASALAPLAVAQAAASVLALLGYVRLRRRGLIAADVTAPLLAGILLAQAALTAMGTETTARVLAGPALFCLWRLSGLVFTAPGHGRFWRGATAALSLAALYAVFKE